MSKLNDFPIKINNTPIPVPIEWSETPAVVENAMTTEAGTDVVDVLRVDKLTVTASFDVSSTWLATFKGWANSTSALTVNIYDPITNAYKQRSMRIRNFVSNLVPNSDKTSGTIGLYNLTFDLIEF
ncbi:MAG: hypothetical protein IKG04_00840 [Exiguobacterium sp.]|nr:hypothetical protein [Exiguobacterium sp.]